MPTPPQFDGNDVTAGGFGHGQCGARPFGHGPYPTFPQWSGAPMPAYAAAATDELTVAVHVFGDQGEQRVRRSRTGARTVTWSYPSCGSAFVAQVQSFFDVAGQTRRFVVQDLVEGPRGALTATLPGVILGTVDPYINAGPAFVARFAGPLEVTRDVGMRQSIPSLTFRRDRLYSLSEEQCDDAYPPAFYWRCTDGTSSTILRNKLDGFGGVQNHGVIQRGITLGVAGPDPLRRPWDTAVETTSAWVQLSGGVFASTAYWTACFRATWPPPDYDVQALMTLYGDNGIWLQWQIDSFGILRGVGSGDNVYIAASAYPITDNAWHFAVLRHDGAAGILHLTLDDAIVGSGASALGLPATMAIGSGSLLGDDRNARYFHGRAQDLTMRMNIGGGLEFPDLAREQRFYGAWRSW